MIVYETRLNTLALHPSRCETLKIVSQRDGEDHRGRGVRLVLATRIVSAKSKNKLEIWILLIANTVHPVSNIMTAQTGPTTPRAMASVE